MSKQALSNKQNIDSTSNNSILHLVANKLKNWNRIHKFIKQIKQPIS